jgi:hypothetical protein
VVVWAAAADAIAARKKIGANILLDINHSIFKIDCPTD